MPIKVKSPILNHDPIENLHDAIMSIKLGLILVILFVMVKVGFYISQFSKGSSHVGRLPTTSLVENMVKNNCSRLPIAVLLTTLICKH
jgi:hypothetical protein